MLMNNPLKLISKTSFDEAIAGAIVGTLSTVDEDIDDTYTYTLSGDDADKFEVVDGQLKLKDGVAADYETQSTYSVTVTSTDSGGLSLSQAFALTVSNVNEPLSKITLDGTNYVVIPEGEKGAVIGEILTNDPDTNDSYTYLLTSWDAEYFEVVDGVLRLKPSIALDYEALTFAYPTPDGDPSKLLFVDVTVIDSAGHAAKDTFLIYVTNVNDAPTAINLWGSNLGPGSNYSAVIGKLEVTDVDDQDFTFTIDSIESNNGKTYSPADFEIVNGILRVKNKDASGNWVEVRGEFGDLITFSISATDSNANIFAQQFLNKKVTQKITSTRRIQPIWVSP